MAFTLPSEPGTTETLQCIACAGLQEIGPSFDVGDLRDLMRQDGTHNKENAVYQAELQKKIQDGQLSSQDDAIINT